MPTEQEIAAMDKLNSLHIKLSHLQVINFNLVPAYKPRNRILNLEEGATEGDSWINHSIKLLNKVFSAVVVPIIDQICSNYNYLLKE